MTSNDKYISLHVNLPISLIQYTCLFPLGWREEICRKYYQRLVYGKKAAMVVEIFRKGNARENEKDKKRYIFPSKSLSWI